MKNLFSTIIVLTFFTLVSGCGGGGGGGGSSSNAAESEMVTVSGSGIKGLLANASVSIYLVDPSYPGSYDSTSPITTGITDQSGNLANLAIPGNINSRP